MIAYCYEKIGKCEKAQEIFKAFYQEKKSNCSETEEAKPFIKIADEYAGAGNMFMACLIINRNRFPDGIAASGDALKAVVFRYTLTKYDNDYGTCLAFVLPIFDEFKKALTELTAKGYSVSSKISLNGKCESENIMFAKCLIMSRNDVMQTSSYKIKYEISDRTFSFSFEFGTNAYSEVLLNILDKYSDLLDEKEKRMVAMHFRIVYENSEYFRLSKKDRIKKEKRIYEIFKKNFGEDDSLTDEYSNVFDEEEDEFDDLGDFYMP